jgi:hypothetical protein
MPRLADDAKEEITRWSDCIVEEEHYRRPMHVPQTRAALARSAAEAATWCGGFFPQFHQNVQDT